MGEENIKSGPEWVKFECSVMVEPGTDSSALNEDLREAIAHTGEPVIGIKNTAVTKINDPDSWLPDA